MPEEKLSGNWRKKDVKGDNALSGRLVSIFKRKVSFQFEDKIMLSKNIAYHDFRKFCGRTFGIKKTEANAMLDVLYNNKIIELSSSGFVVKDKKFFMS